MLNGCQDTWVITMLFNVHSIEKANQIIQISEKAAEFIGVQAYQKILVKFGSRQGEAKVEVKPTIEENSFLLSEGLIQDLLIDTEVSYEIKRNNNTLIIGPVIGLLLGKREEKLEQQLEHVLLYTQLYSRVNGLLFVFAEDQIDFQEEKITGYVYDPKAENPWRKRILPFPAAIFRRVELSKNVLNDITKVIGKRMFNADYFNKWEFWNIMKLFSHMSANLPKTEDKPTLEKLEAFLSSYHAVYLKPRDGSRGKGIYYITQNEDVFKVQQNYEEDIQHFSKEEMKQFLGKHPYYLLQQPIQLKEYQNRKIDYRVIIQKNEYGNWQCTGIIGRFGKEGAVSSNFLAEGFAKTGFETVQLQFNCGEKKAYQLCGNMIEVCINTAKAIDSSVGPYGDLGIDVGIDENEHIWVIEVNKRPDHDLPLMIKDRKMYYEVKTNPVLYAAIIAMQG
jgi:hypothetical protein